MKKPQAQQYLLEIGLDVGYSTSQGTTIWWKGNCYVITLPVSRMNRKQLLDVLKESGVIR